MKTLESQKEAVYKAVVKFSKGKSLSDEAKAKIYLQLENDFLGGRIGLKPTAENLIKLAEARILRTYIIGLVSNWLRKDDRLAKIAA